MQFGAQYTALPTSVLRLDFSKIWERSDSSDAGQRKGAGFSASHLDFVPLDAECYGRG